MAADMQQHHHQHHPHQEEHFEAPEFVRDVVIGMSDGLTVPFALAAGLSGAVGSTALILTAGFAEIAAGSIAMGLGGYLAARTDSDHYRSEREREWRECEELPDREKHEVAEVLITYGLPEEQVAPMVEAIASDRERWVDFMMRFELGLEEPEPKRALSSALTIAGSYIAGGAIPLIPYMIFGNPASGLAASAVVTLLALFIFGYVKGRLVGMPALRSALQTTVVGGLAAAVAFVAARVIGR